MSGAQRPPPTSSGSYSSRGGPMSTSGGGGPGAKKPPPRGAWGTASPSPSMASPSLPNGTPAGAPNAWKIPAAATTTTAAAAPSAPNGVGKAGGGVDEKTMMTAMHDRMVWLMTNFIGSKLVVHLKSGPPLTGILSSAGTDSELCLTLSRAYPVPSLTPSSSTRPATPPPPSHPDDVKHSIIILGNELVDVEVHAVDWDERARSDASFMGSSSTNNGSSSNRFRTDAETTGQAGSVREKELQAWTGGADVSGGIEDGPDDLAATLFPSDGRPSRGGPSSTRTLSKPWDQFEQNEKLFGLKTDFDEEIYTTKLDRSGKDYKERERQADRLAREILTGTAGKDVGAHVREERGFVDDSGTNEEDKYGAVVRGEGAYVPPGARKEGAYVPPSARKPLPEEQKPSPSVAAARESASVTPTAPATSTPLATSASTAVPAVSTPTAAANPDANNNKGSEAAERFRTFVSAEKEKALQQKQAYLKSDRDKRYADFKAFSESFKVPMAMPKDIVPLLAKDSAKQEELLSRKPDPASSQATPTSGKTPVQTAAEQERVREWQARTAAANADLNRAIKIAAIPAFKPRGAPAGAGAGTGASAATTPATNQTAIAGSATASPAMGAQKTPGPAKFGIREIPPFKPKGESPGTTGTKLSLKAPAFNPAAKSFTPGLASSTASSAPGPPSDQSKSGQATSPANPFFGTKPPKKGSSSMHVKEDFTPFKAGNVPPDPASVSPYWSSGQGRSYKAMFGLYGPGVGPGQQPGGPQQAPPPPHHLHHQQQHHHHQQGAGGHHPSQHQHPHQAAPWAQQMMPGPMHLPSDEEGMAQFGGGPGQAQGGLPPGMAPPAGFGMYPGGPGGVPFRPGFPNGPPMGQVNGGGGAGNGPGGGAPGQQGGAGASGGPPMGFNPAAAAAMAQFAAMGAMGGPGQGGGGAGGGGPPGQAGGGAGGMFPPHMGPPPGQPGMFGPGMFSPGRGPPMGGPNGQMFAYQQAMPHHFGPPPPDGRMHPNPPPMRYEQ